MVVRFETQSKTEEYLVIKLTINLIHDVIQFRIAFQVQQPYQLAAVKNRIKYVQEIDREILRTKIRVELNRHISLSLIYFNIDGTSDRERYFKYIATGRNRSVH